MVARRYMFAGATACLVVGIVLGVLRASCPAAEVVKESPRQIPIAGQADVVVVGGSTGAVAAATAAAQGGAKVILIAPFPYLGDDMTATLRLWLEKGETSTSPLGKRLFSDPVAATKKTPAAEVPVEGLPSSRPMHVKMVLDDALLSAGVTFLFSSYATDVLRDASGNPCGIVMANRSGRQAVIAKVIIDATDRAGVARLAGAKFRPYPAGDHTFQWVVIGGLPHEGAKARVRTIDPPFQGPAPVSKKHKGPPPPPITYPIYQYTLTLPMPDASDTSWAQAEQQARAMTYDPGQQFTSDILFEVPPDPMVGKTSATGVETLSLDALRSADVPRVYVLGGCADIPREQAEKLLRPLALVELGTRLGAAVAEETKSLPAAQSPQLPASKSDAPVAGEVRESLAGMRPVDKPVTLTQEARGLPVLGKYDVVVVGGGTGGAPAGIAAARQGAKTLVIEYLHTLGGVGTAGAISSYCAGNPVGFTATVMQQPGRKPSGAWLIEPKNEWWRSKLQEAGATVWCGAIGCGAVVEQGRVTGVIVATPNGRGVVLAHTVIDATGNADVAAAAGAACRYTDASEFGMQGTGLAPRELGGSYANTDFTITDETDLVDVWQVLVYSKLKYPKVFDQGRLIDTRERRTIVGEYMLTVLDEVTARTFPDTVIQARGGSYDTHGYTVDPYLLLSHPNTAKLVTCIPYRCLLPETLDGILVIGLGMSIHRDAVPLTRMQRDIQNGGYAAGVAAAMAAKSGTLARKIDVRALQEHLIQAGNLTKNVLTDKDSHPIPAEKIAEAVKDLAKENPTATAIVFAQPKESLPLLRSAYASAEGKAKLNYALILAVLGDATGVDTVIEQVKNTASWDRGWNYKGMGQFGNAMSPLDVQLAALGRAGDRRALPVILEKLKLLSSQTEFSHHRAVALALELLHDPAAAKPLADLLGQTGMSGYVHTTIQKAIERETPGGTCSEQTRRESIRELVLARALYRCGDDRGVGRQTLEAYTHDLRGHLSRHAKAVLDAPVKN